MSDEKQVKMEAAVVNSRPVKTQGHIPVPRRVRELVGVSGEGSSTFWNYDTENGYVVLSDTSLNGGRYEFIDLSDFYEEKKNGDRDIRPPSKLPDEVGELFQPRQYEEGYSEVENRAFFLASEEMVESDPVCVYLLNTVQMAEVVAKVPFYTGRGMAGSDVSPWDVDLRKVGSAGRVMSGEGVQRKNFGEGGTYSVVLDEELPRPR